MAQRIHPGPVLSAVLAAAALVWLTPSAHAADYCVTCKNPDETYRCRVTGVGANYSDALKLFCVIRTAKDGKHASCAAEKATSACVGLVKVYNYDGPALPDGLTTDARVRKLKQRVERDQRTFEEPKGEAPKSLFELGGRAVDASRQGLRNAGSAIGLGSSDSEAAPQAAPAAQAANSTPGPAEPPRSRSFARRSYDCVLSFFRDCGRDE